MPFRKKICKKPTRYRFNKLARLLFIGASVVSSTAFAQQIITLELAINKTLNLHPSLKPYIYQQQASDAMVEQAQVISPMTINATFEDALGTGRYSGLSSLQTTVGISWILEEKQIAARVGLANQQATLIPLQQATQMLDVAAQTATIFTVLLSQQQQLKLAKLAESQAQQLLTEISKRVTLGQLNVIDKLRAQADLSKKALVVEDLLHEIEASKSQLAAQWQGSDDFIVQGSLAIIPELKQIEVAYQQLKSHPNYKLFASKQHSLRSEIELAKATALPAWQVNAGVRRNEAADDFSVIAGISIPFGEESRNRHQIAALRAKQNQLQANADAWYQRLSTEVLMLIHKLKHNSHVVDGLSEQTIPALEQAAIKAKISYKTGNYSYTDLFAIEQELLATKTELIAAYTNIQLFNIELERLTGAAISK